MRERPILFSAPMVRAILAGTKTQTRRIVKPVRGYEHNNVCRPDMAADSHAVWWHGESERVGCLQACPYGAPGDLLWVRESWGHCDRDNVIYRADDIEALARERQWVSWPTWRPSIFMPRWASRLTLEVTGVRVERLHAITEEDAKAEGVGFAYRQDGPGTFARDSARAAFEQVWHEINGAESWDANPRVWVVEFRRDVGGDR